MSSISKIDFFNFFKSKSLEPFESPSKYTQYYLDALDKYKEKKNVFKFEFNWPAFFFGIFWLIYRKMYFYAIALAMLEFLIIYFHPELDLMLKDLIVMIVFGIIGTPIYINFAEQKIAKGRMKSGTNIHGVLVIFFIMFYLPFVKLFVSFI